MSIPNLQTLQWKLKQESEDGRMREWKKKEQRRLSICFALVLGDQRQQISLLLLLR
jgi:hypothetical protein